MVGFKGFRSPAGYLIGAAFFAASFTPSLIPRTALTQAVVSGLSLSVGYGLGAAAAWVWCYLELPVPGTVCRRWIVAANSVTCAAMVGMGLWQASEWQNDISRLMQLPERKGQLFESALFALVVFAALVLLAGLFRWTLRVVFVRLKPHVPRRVAKVGAFAAAFLLFWLLVNGLVFRIGMRAADMSFQQIDALKDEGIDKPLHPQKTGSSESLIRWATLGRAGRQFVAGGPTREQIAAFSGADALEPIRVYVGLNSAETVRDRVLLALEELKRVHGFERSVLVIVTPTGRGWIDPAAMDTLEYLHAGDVASVAVQYSYLPSWLSLLVEPSYGIETARELFLAVYGYWTKLPHTARPRLYLFGLSLGTLNSDLSADLFDIVADPFQGALWSGPPFNSRTWRFATQNKAPGSPAWLPRFRDSSIIRFTNQENALDIPGASWGPIRIVYLQYASDAITFFDPTILYRRPEWLDEPRGPDVSRRFRWFPVVTMLQLAVDMMASPSSPMGYGHVYAPEHYIDAWVHVTDVKWNAEEIARLKALFSR